MGGALADLRFLLSHELCIWSLALPCFALFYALCPQPALQPLDSNEAQAGAHDSPL